MSFYRNRRAGTSAFVCDECSGEIETNTSDFHDALESFKAEGGAARLVDGEWLHLCEDCQ